ncbi:MAG: Rho termination factor N-terminal domain-containing protein, partial [Acidimicrobiales bacterium]|nr:Rho termination factor N-terminal domain-containing protein [Acidimicrobiales bacterium]
METTEMRRSTLQRKDRDELTQIAETLGKKPPSRARKGEIIDLILDLAAGGDGSSVGAPTDKIDDGPTATVSPQSAQEDTSEPPGTTENSSDSEDSDPT